jgi:hypothetical protein
MPITLTRQQLYDRAWTTPIVALAQELGLSGRGLGKLCDRYDIPVPPPGWWAKKAAGGKREGIIGTDTEARDCPPLTQADPLV